MEVRLNRFRLPRSSQVSFIVIIPTALLSRRISVADAIDLTRVEYLSSDVCAFSLKPTNPPSPPEAIRPGTRG